LDCRRTLEVDERRELPGRTASMTLLRVKGMVEEMGVSGEEEGEEDASEGGERAKLLVENRKGIECFIPVGYLRRQHWRNHGACPSKM
jgi:hypothetical protein